MSYLFRAGKYFRYWLDEVNQHSLHSPFIYELYTQVIACDDNGRSEDVENLRRGLLKDERILEYADPGASKKTFRKRYVKDIARSSLSDERFSRLYSRIIKYTNPSFVAELGTSLGINTLYLSGAGKEVFTFEGVPALCEISKQNFLLMNADNIHLIEGNIDEKLPLFLEKQQHLPFIFFDANHTYEATMRYFQWCIKNVGDDSIFIFDDIYWSKGMARAWEEIKAHEAVIVTLDLYRCGIVLFNRSLTPQHIALKF